MLSTEQVLELLRDENVTAEEAGVLRDAARAMAEIVYEKWRSERN